MEACFEIVQRGVAEIAALQPTLFIPPRGRDRPHQREGRASFESLRGGAHQLSRARVLVDTV